MIAWIEKRGDDLGEWALDHMGVVVVIVVLVVLVVAVWASGDRCDTARRVARTSQDSVLVALRGCRL